MQTPEMLFVYALNSEVPRAQKLVAEDRRVGFVRYRNPKFWETSGISELLTVPGAKYNTKTEEWSFSQCTPDVWVLAGSPFADAIVKEYEACGVSAKIVGAAKPDSKPRKKRTSKKSAAKSAEE